MLFPGSAFWEPSAFSLDMICPLSASTAFTCENHTHTKLIFVYLEHTVWFWHAATYLLDYKLIETSTSIPSAQKWLVSLCLPLGASGKFLEMLSFSPGCLISAITRWSWLLSIYIHYAVESTEPLWWSFRTSILIKSANHETNFISDCFKV